MLLVCGCNGDSNGADASSDATNDGKPSKACSGDFDCPNIGDKCWFVVDGGCSLQNLSGTCMAFTPPDKCAPTVACGCDNTTISVCGPAGYVDRSSNFAGPCPDDGGAEAATDASSDASPE
jgi:hypothetical protein